MIKNFKSILNNGYEAALLMIFLLEFESYFAPFDRTFSIANSTFEIFFCLKNYIQGQFCLPKELLTDNHTSCLKVNAEEAPVVKFSFLESLPW